MSTTSQSHTERGSTVQLNRSAREAAMQLLYSMEMTGELASVAGTTQAQSVPDHECNGQAAANEAAETSAGDEPGYVGEKISSDDRAIVDTVLDQLVQHKEEIDSDIESLSHRWKLNRMSRVDLSILRLAFFEIEYLHTPVKIAINEAVELAKKYSGEKSYKFVNGVLAGYVRASSQT